MTTLPTTTTPGSRTPNSSSLPSGTNGNGAITAFGGGGLAPPGAGALGAPLLSWGDAWRILRGNMWLIVGMLILSIVGGVALNMYLARYRPSYTAFGVLQVEPIMSQNPLVPTPAALDMNTLSIEQRSHQALLSSESLLSRVFQNTENEIRRTAWFLRFVGEDGKPDVGAAKRALHDQLEVGARPNSKHIELSISTRNPQDARLIVQTIGDQYIRDQQSETRRDQLKRSTQLNQMKEQYERSRLEISRVLREKSLQLNIDGMGAPGRLSAKEMELQMLVKEQRDADSRFQEARGLYEMVIGQIQRGETPGAVNELVERDQVVIAAQQQEIYAERDKAEAVATFGSNHPRINQYEQRVRAMQERLDQVRGERVAYHTAILSDQVRSDLAVAKQLAESYTERVETLKKELGQLANAMSDYLTAKDEEQAYREMLKKVNEELNFIRQADSQNELGGISWAPGGQPITPEEPTSPKLPKTVGLCVMLGLSLSIGIAFVRELTDQTVRSPADINRIGQMVMLGMIADQSDDPEGAKASLPLVIFERPNSLMADQFRQVRTRLQYAASLDTTRSMLVTSPGVGDGKTTVACNLAAGLALNGRRILLVDSDFRRPEVHRAFGLDNAKGFSDALLSLGDFESCVKAGVLQNLPNLAIMTAGPRPANATELLESQLLTDFMEKAFEAYDHVIFDCGSLMVVSEAVALAPRVDGVITVVRARHNSRGLLLRTRDTLRQVKAEHLGVILNGAKALGGGYYSKNIKTYYAYERQST